MCHKWISICIITEPQNGQFETSEIQTNWKPEKWNRFLTRWSRSCELLGNKVKKKNISKFTNIDVGSADWRSPMTLRNCCWHNGGGSRVEPSSTLSRAIEATASASSRCSWVTNDRKYIRGLPRQPEPGTSASNQPSVTKRGVTSELLAVWKELKNLNPQTNTKPKDHNKYRQLVPCLNYSCIFWMAFVVILQMLNDAKINI